MPDRSWRELLADPNHPIWSMFGPTFRSMGLVLTLFIFQQYTATSWDLDGEGVALGAVTVGKILEEVFFRGRR